MANRFSAALTTVEALFATPLVVGGTTVKVYPANYQGNITATEWVRLNVFSFNSELFFGSQASTGQIVCNIFVPSGTGQRRAVAIADVLDAYLSRKIFSSIQTTNGYINNIGVEKNDSGLYRIDYIVNFNNFNN